MLSLILDILLPRVCLLCGGKVPCGETQICRRCWSGARPIKDPICKICGRPIILQNQSVSETAYLCHICRERKWALDCARAAYIFDGPVREAIHSMKYLGHYTIGAWLSSKMIDVLGENIINVKKDKDVIIVDVPLAPERLRHREFNQSYILAKRIGRILNLKVGYKILERKGGGRPQVGLKIKERWSNIRGQFRVKRPEYIKNKRVILIDDVFTTGATVNECSKVIKRAGATSVKAWTLARVV